MTKEEFFQQACLQAITRVEPAYWDDLGVKRIIEFADAVTNKVFSKEESINEEKLDELAEEFANKYSVPYTQQHCDLQCGFQAGFKAREAMV